MASNLDSVFDAAGQAFGVDPGILRGIAQTESAGDPKAASVKGARGLMQIIPATAQALGVDANDPVQAIWGAANLLSQNLKRFGNVPDALRAYNAGPTPARWNNPETAAYVGRVAANYQPSVSATPDPEPAPMPQTASAAPADAYSQLFGNTAPVTQPPAAASNPAPTGDAYTQLFGQTDPKTSAGDAKGAWHQGTVLGNFVQGLGHAAYKVDEAIGRGTMAAVNAIPGVSGALAGTGLDPAKLAAFDANRDAEYQNNYAASPAAQAGATTANALMMAGAGAGATGLTGLGGGALANVIGGTGGRVVQGATNLLTGAGAASGAGRVLTAATSGAAQGAGLTAATGGDASQTGENALLGAVLGPAGLAAGAGLRYGGKVLAKGGNALLDLVAPANDATAAAAVPATPAVAAPAPGAAPTPNSPNNPLTAAGAAPASPTPPPPAAPVQPEPVPPRVSMGILPNPAKAADLAQQVYDHYAAGGPTTLVESQIPGVRLTAAQATGNANLARLESFMRDQEPNAFAALEKSNAAARTNYASNIIGTPDMVDAAEAARDAATSQARETAFSNPQPVNAQPALDHLANLIASNDGRPTVQQPLLAVQKQLDALAPAADDGSRMADPEKLYNLRKYLGDMISPRAAGTANDGQAAATQLMALKPTLDDAIESGAPGFKDYIGQFDQLSRPIDAMRFLQSKNIVNADGVVQRGKLDSMLNAIQAQKNLPGYRLADSVTPEQIEGLTKLRDDMNLANQSNLGKSLGSNTAQNLFVAGKTNALMSGVGGHAANLLASGLGMTEAGPVGLVAGGVNRLAQAAYAGRLTATQEAAKQALLKKMLYPNALTAAASPSP